MRKAHILQNQKGLVLIWLIVTMLVIGIAGAAIYTLTSESTLTGVFKNNNLKAYYLAEAGGRYAAPLIASDLGSGTTTYTGTGGAQSIINCYFNVGGGNFMLTGVDGRGSGYTSAPTVSFSGGGGSNAQATATVLNGMITAINVIAGGSGYTTAPTVSFSGGGGSGAQAVVTISGGTVQYVRPVYTLTSTATVNSGTWLQTQRRVNFQILAGVGGGTLPGSGATNTGTSSFSSTANFNQNWATSAISTGATAGSTGPGGVLSLSLSQLWGFLVVENQIGMKWTYNPPTTYDLQIKTSVDGGSIFGGSWHLIGLNFRLDGVNSPLDFSTWTYSNNTYGLSYFRNEGTFWQYNWPPSMLNALQTIPSGGSGTTATATAILAVTISQITLTNGGSGYHSAPTVGFIGGGGTGAAATAEITGTVTSINVTDGGRYSSTPTVAISGGGGNYATATAIMQGSGSNKRVSSVRINNQGSGYHSAPAVSFSGGSPSRTATATAEITGLVTSITLSSSGSGYTSAPSISFSGGGGSGAAATAIVAGGVDHVNILNVGSGYDSSSPPAVTFSGGGGSGAAATAVVSAAGAVTSINRTAAGSGYTSAPSVVIDPPPSGYEFVVLWKQVNTVYSIIDYKRLTQSDGVLNADGTLKDWSTLAVYLSQVSVNGVLKNSIRAYIAGPNTYPYGTVTWTNPPFTAVNWHTNGTNAILDGSITGEGSGATASATVSGGRVTKLMIITGGSNYTDAPAVNITGGGGSGATATTTINNGVVNSITITNSGSGYTSAPAVYIYPPEIGVHAFSNLDVYFADFSGLIPSGSSGAGGGIISQYY